MELQGLLIMMFLLIVIPLFALSANHNIFFVLISIFLLFSSFNKINSYLFGRLNKEDDNIRDHAEDDEDESISHALKRFGIGTKVIINMIIILFYIYCSFFIILLPLRILIAILIVGRAYEILINVNKKYEIKKHDIKSRIHILIQFHINIAEVAIVFYVAWSKFIQYF